MNVLRRTALGFLGLLIFSAVVAPVCAQQEFPPPRGKGRAVVVISGHDGAPAYRGVAQEIAQLGYDVVLFDANSIATNDTAATLRSAVQQAQQMAHALPGKVGFVGFSQGGGQVLIYGSQMPDIATVVIAWYPATRSISDAAAFAARMRLPVLMLAGEMDNNHGCCEISTARMLAEHAACFYLRELPLQPRGLCRRHAAHRGQAGRISRPATGANCPSASRDAS